MRAQLKTAGHEVDVAMGGEEALARLENGARFDLVLSDVVMPGPVQGPDLAQAVLRLQPQTRIVFMSGYPKETAVGAAGLPSGIPLLQKPLTMGQLLDAVRSTLAAPPNAG